MFYLAVGLIAIGIILVQFEAYNYLRILNNSSTPNASGVNLLFNYGNGTIVWYNETSIPKQSNLYDLTFDLANGNVQATFWPQYNEHFVTAINGVENHSPYYWTVWLYCQRHNSWTVSQVGADDVKIGNGGTFAWAYEVPYHSPAPGAATIDSCS